MDRDLFQTGQYCRMKRSRQFASAIDGSKIEPAYNPLLNADEARCFGKSER